MLESGLAMSALPSSCDGCASDNEDLISESVVCSIADTMILQHNGTLNALIDSSMAALLHNYYHDVELAPSGADCCYEPTVSTKRLAAKAFLPEERVVLSCINVPSLHVLALRVCAPTDMDQLVSFCFFTVASIAEARRVANTGDFVFCTLWDTAHEAMKRVGSGAIILAMGIRREADSIDRRMLVPVLIAKVCASKLLQPTHRSF